MNHKSNYNKEVKALKSEYVSSGKSEAKAEGKARHETLQSFNSRYGSTWRRDKEISKMKEGTKIYIGTSKKNDWD